MRQHRIETHNNFKHGCMIENNLECKGCKFINVENNDFKNPQEKQNIINEIIQKPYCAARMFLKFSHWLTEKQLQQATSTIFKNTYATYIILSRSPDLDLEIREKALQIIIDDITYIKYFLMYCNPTFCEKIMILKYHIANANFLTFYLKTFTKQSLDRKLAFKNLLFNPKKLKQLAIMGKLSQEELKVVYFKYRQMYFDSCKRVSPRYLRYCEIFHLYLNEKEKQLLVKKLMRQCDNDYLYEALEHINFDKQQYKKLKDLYTLKKISAY